jgi:NAD+ diphosphatase
VSFPPVFIPGVRPPEHTPRKLWFAFRGRNVLVNESYRVPPVGSLSEIGLEPVRTQYLGTLGDQHCFSAELSADAEPPEGACFMDLRGLFGNAEEHVIALAGRAVQIVDWDRNHLFCGACGGATEHSEAQRSRRCERCELEVFPRLSPAIIVAVERGNEILLARSPHFPSGIHSVLAGFVEPGESIEDAVVREVFEETRIRVNNVRYFGSQPWPFPNSIMIGFQADYEGGEIELDGDELEAAAFYTPDALPPVFPGRVSISQWLLADFLERQGAARRP